MHFSELTQYSESNVKCSTLTIKVGLLSAGSAHHSPSEFSLPRWAQYGDSDEEAVICKGWISPVDIPKGIPHVVPAIYKGQHKV